MLVVEQSGNGGGAKKAKAGSSGEEIAARINYQAVAVADKQDDTNKQYCKIHRIKGHDLQNCRQVELLMEKQRAEYEGRDKEKGQGGAEGSSKKRGGRGGSGDKEKQQGRPARGRDKKEEDDDHDDDDDESTKHEFQKGDKSHVC